MIATLFTYTGFLTMLVGIGATFGWPIAAIVGGGLMFAAGVLSEGRQGGDD